KRRTCGSPFRAVCEIIQVGEGENASAAPPLLWPLGVICVKCRRCQLSQHVRFAPESGQISGMAALWLISDIAESDFGCTLTRFIPPCILCLCEVLHRRTRLSVASSKARQRLGIWLSEGPQWTDKHSHQESSSITTTERSAKHVGSRGRRYLFTPTTLATAR